MSRAPSSKPPTYWQRRSPCAAAHVWSQRDLGANPRWTRPLYRCVILAFGFDIVAHLSAFRLLRLSCSAVLRLVNTLQQRRAQSSATSADSFAGRMDRPYAPSASCTRKSIPLLDSCLLTHSINWRTRSWVHMPLGIARRSSLRGCWEPSGAIRASVGARRAGS